MLDERAGRKGLKTYWERDERPGCKAGPSTGQGAGRGRVLRGASEAGAAGVRAGPCLVGWDV